MTESIIADECSLACYIRGHSGMASRLVRLEYWWASSVKCHTQAGFSIPRLPGHLCGGRVLRTNVERVRGALLANASTGLSLGVRSQVFCWTRKGSPISIFLRSLFVLPLDGSYGGRAGREGFSSEREP